MLSREAVCHDPAPFPLPEARIYSLRSASIGSIDAARNAGSTAATATITEDSTTAPVSVAGPHAYVCFCRHPSERSRLRSHCKRRSRRTRVPPASPLPPAPSHPEPGFPHLRRRFIAPKVGIERQRDRRCHKDSGSHPRPSLRLIPDPYSLTPVFFLSTPKKHPETTNPQ